MTNSSSFCISNVTTLYSVIREKRTLFTTVGGLYFYVDFVEFTINEDDIDLYYTMELSDMGAIDDPYTFRYGHQRDLLSALCLRAVLMAQLCEALYGDRDRSKYFVNPTTIYNNHVIQ